MVILGSIANLIPAIISSYTHNIITEIVHKCKNVCAKQFVYPICPGQYHNIMCELHEIVYFDTVTLLMCALLPMHADVRTVMVYFVPMWFGMERVWSMTHWLR